jgi:pimeloyl-ACP methyl ester carboxylesterase
VYHNNNQNAPAIIFLHGNSASLKTWERQFNSFLNDKYHLIAYDFLGFGDSGRSQAPETDYDVTSLSGSLLSVISHFNLDQYFLVGHSLGGHIMVQTIEDLPGCKGIISIGAPPISSAQDIGKFYLPTAPVGVMFSNEFTEEALEATEENFFFSPDNKPPFFKEDFRKADGRSREAIGQILASTNFKNEVDVLNRIQTPKAFVNGAGERSINNNYYFDLDFPGTWKEKVYLIQNAGHAPHWENAAEVNRLIDEFVEAHV